MRKARYGVATNSRTCLGQRAAKIHKMVSDLFAMFKQDLVPGHRHGSKSSKVLYPSGFKRKRVGLNPQTPSHATPPLILISPAFSLPIHLHNVNIGSMVTGVETAGLVLGSIPLLILAIEKWHKGFVKARAIAGLTTEDRDRIATKINGLATALKSHSGQLNINLKALLKAADPDLDLDGLPQDYRDQLWKGSTADLLDEYLRRMGGEDAIEGFRGEIEASKLIVEEIGHHFRQGKEKVAKTI